MPKSFTLEELTGRNPHKEFDSYLSLRGRDPFLHAYGRVKGGDEEDIPGAGCYLSGLCYLYSREARALRRTD